MLEEEMLDKTEKKSVPEFWCKFDSVRHALNVAAGKHLKSENKEVEKFISTIEEEMSKVELFEIVGESKLL